MQIIEGALFNPGTICSSAFNSAETAAELIKVKLGAAFQPIIACEAHQSCVFIRLV